MADKDSEGVDREKEKGAIPKKGVVRDRDRVFEELREAQAVLREKETRGDEQCNRG